MDQRTPQNPAQADPIYNFETRVLHLRGQAVVRLPAEVSAALPSRGMGMARVTLDGVPRVVPLEPDGLGGHWFLAEEPLPASVTDLPGSTVTVTLAPLAQWPEPPVPEDMLVGLRQAGLLPAWESLTTKARWEWLRWIRSTQNPATRERRIRIACDKLQHGARRPCCFNSAACTVPELSREGVLQTPAAK